VEVLRAPSFACGTGGDAGEGRGGMFGTESAVGTFANQYTCRRAHVPRCLLAGTTSGLSVHCLIVHTSVVGLSRRVRPVDAIGLLWRVGHSPLFRLSTVQLCAVISSVQAGAQGELGPSLWVGVGRLKKGGTLHKHKSSCIAHNGWWWVGVCHILLPCDNLMDEAGA
jgi:hypothetical protein